MNGGYTTLSASGLLLDRKDGYALTSATLLSPFMQGDSLRKGVIVEMLTNGLSGVLEESDSSSKWIPMKLVRILKDESIHALLQRFRGDADWTAGWPRGSDSSSGHLGEIDLARRENMSQAFWAGFEDIALLQIENDGNVTGVRAKLNALRRDLHAHHLQVEFNVIDPTTVKKGNHLLLIASPYGILSPSVFHNCVYSSMVSNVITMDAFTRLSQQNFPKSATTTSDDGDDSESSLSPSRTSVLQSSASLPHSSSSHSPIGQNPSSTTIVTSTIQQSKARARRLKSAVLANTVDRISGSSLQSSMISQSSCVILIDQPGLPGCEGGPVFDSQGSLLGLLAPPLRRSDGSNVEVHLILPIYPFLQQLVRDASGKVPLFDRAKGGFKLEPVSAQSKPSSTTRVLLQDGEDKVSSPYHQAIGDYTQVANKAMSSIAVISIGTYWGSGVIVSPDGYLITSAHIFRSFLSPSSSPQNPILKPGYHTYIRIDSDSLPVLHGPPPPSPHSFQYNEFTSSSSSSSSNISMISGGTRTLGSSSNTAMKAFNNHWHKASLVYVSSSHLDVALVKIDRPPPSLPVLRICSAAADGTPMEGCVKEPLEGEAVLALGFALFGPSKRIKATATSGVISRVAHLHGQPKLVQTSASVNKGASGGALVDARGNFVGLVTCNAMTKDGIIIPKINFSIPANLLLPIEEFIHTRRWEALQAIERNDAECAALWSMSALSDDTNTPNVSPPPPPPSPPIPDLFTRVPQSSSSSSSSSQSHHNQQQTNTNQPQTTLSDTQMERGSRLREFWSTQLASVPQPAALKARL